MAKSAKTKTSSAVTVAAGLSATSATGTNADIACRAYDLYLARGGEHGHDVEDWVQAERELGRAGRITLA